ncbi:MAG: gluconate 2-dehydrogenase gamma chain [Gaiellales bacterium]|nr:gluconate 2-dehydrogenase gamma chain [Gaiellales bacterium]
MNGNGSGEEPRDGLSRGQLLRRAGTLGAAATIPGAATGSGAEASAVRAAADAASADDALRTLTPAEAITLEAVLERLLPSGVAGPGAKEAKVLRYIDWALAGELSVFHAPYSAGLAAIDVFATQTYKAAFAALTPDRQDALIARMAAGSEKAVPPTQNTDPQQGFLGFSPTSASVFTMIRTHALQGMFGDPMHGGNVDQVGWKLVRFPGPRLIVSKRDQLLDVAPKQYMKSTYTYPLFKHTPRRP